MEYYSENKPDSSLQKELENETVKKDFLIKMASLLCDQAIKNPANNDSPLTALHTALVDNVESVVDYLLERGVSVLTKDKAGQCSALYFAVMSENKNMVEKVLNKGAKVNDTHGWNKETALHVALKNNLEEIATYLLSRGANPALISDNGSALFSAVQSGNKNMVEVILKKGCSPNEKITFSKEGTTLLHYAVEKNYDEIVRLLLKSGADVKATDNYTNTPLRFAISNENASLVHLLLDRGADVVSSFDKCQTPLHCAASISVKMVDLLLKRGADINARDKDGLTPLIRAAEVGKADVVDALIRKGANVNEMDRRGYSPLHSTRSREVAEVLLKAGADVNSRTKGGDTPMHLALKNSRTAVVETLLCAGARDDIEDVTGRTFVHVYYDRLNDPDKSLLEFVIKLKLAKTKHRLTNKFSYDEKPFKKFKTACFEELEKLKSAKYGDFSLYEMMTEKAKAGYLVRSKKLKKRINGTLHEDFPIYGSFLKNRFFQAEKRNADLLESSMCKAVVTVGNTSVGIKLPENISRQIIRELSDEDFDVLMKHSVNKQFINKA